MSSLNSMTSSWYQLLDSSTGKNFYANPKTGICTWREPKEGKILKQGVLPTWWEMYDQSSQLPYYYNAETEETYWELPEDLDVYPVPLTSEDDKCLGNKLGPVPSDGSLLLDHQNNEILEEVEHEVSEPESNELTPSLYEDTENNLNKHWEEVEDPRTGYKYYLHRKTRKLTWTKLEAYEASILNDEIGLNNLPEPPPPLEMKLLPKNNTSSPSETNIPRSNPPPKPSPRCRRQRSMAFGQIDFSNMISENSSEKIEEGRADDTIQSLPITYGNETSDNIPLQQSKSEENILKPKPTNPPPSVPTKRPSNPPPKIPPKLGIPKGSPPIPKKAPPPEPQCKKAPFLSSLAKGKISLSQSQPNVSQRAPKKTFNRLPPNLYANVENVIAKSHSNSSLEVQIQTQPSIPKPIIAPPKPSSVPPPIPTNTGLPGTSTPPPMPVVHNQNTNLYSPKPPQQNTRMMKSQSSIFTSPTVRPTFTRMQSTVLHSPNNNVNSIDKNSKSPRPSMPDELKQQLNSFQLEGFAEQYFRNMKRGVFRRTVPVRERLTWSKDNLKAPLLKLDKKLEKKAMSTFKSIQIYMGDRSHDTPKEEKLKLIQEFIDIGLKHADIRDELYCQICKQVTLNPNQESMHKGWDIMTASVQFFPPTKDLEPWLMNFMKEHGKLDDAIVTKSVDYSLRKLEIISKNGAILRVPDLSEVEHALTAALKPHIFGALLEDVCNTHGMENNVPRVLTALLNRLKELNAHQTEGIFRIPGSTVECAKMRLQIEQGDYNLSSYIDPHISGSVLKFWFRSLEEPVIPSTYYWKCLDSIKAENIEQMNQTIRNLPSINYNVLICMIRYLQILIEPENQQQTKMGIQNIAIVFGPSFVRCPSPDPRIILESQQWEQRFIVTLIKHFKE